MPEGRGLLDAYAEVRRGRMGEMRRLLEEEPADWSGVFDQVKALYGDEDELVRGRLGEERARRLREAQREERLALLAIAATLAGRAWEDALAR